MKRIVYIFSLFMLFATLAQAQSPKREFRSAWLTTVWAIDWPNDRDNTDAATAAQKKQMENILDRYVATNINACFFQVRTMCDAFYKSSYEPWSQWLCGERGKAPQYDPLAFVIAEAHKRGIEVHAWINPYRYATSEATYGTLLSDYSIQHPSWLLNCGGTTILNPGMPEVRQRIVDIVKEIVTNYDVDGIVFDDYFYVSGGSSNEMDQAQYDAYNPDNLSRGDWRRQNVNKMVAEVQTAIKSIKPWCRFGIGPAGIAASSKSVADKYGVTPCPSGSDWQYDGIYSDPLAWLQQQSIDYISPQVYWVIGASSGDYSKVTPWWYTVSNKFSRQCFISASLSALSGTNVNYAPARGMTEREKMAAAATYLPMETVNEIKINYASVKDGAPGMVFFSSNKIATKGFVETLTHEVWTQPAMVPGMTWYAPTEHGMVTDMAITDGKLTWQYSQKDVRYGVYVIPKAERNNAKALQSSLYYKGLVYSKEYSLLSGFNESTYSVAVSVVDRYGNEYAPRFYGEEQKSKVIPKLSLPSDKAEIFLPGWLSWEPIDDAVSYTIEISTSPDFSTLMLHKQIDTCAFLTNELYELDGKQQTFWRVKANVANAESEWSETRSFTGRLFAVTYPQDGSGDVVTTPTITWEDAGASAKYHIDIATQNTFKNAEIVYSADLTTTEVTLPAGTLKYGTSYYVRVIVHVNGLIVESPTNMFSTENLVMTAPEIVAPEVGETLQTHDVTIRWTEVPNNGFRVELSDSESFPTRTMKIKTTDINVYEVTYTGLSTATYYVRVKTKTNAGYTSPSEVRSFTIDETAAVDNLTTKEYNKVEKIIDDGQVIILLPDGKQIDVLGRER